MTLQHKGWRKSSHSTPNGDCIEVGHSPTGEIGIRDTKAGSTGAVLEFTRSEWAAFLTAVRSQ